MKSLHKIEGEAKNLDLNPGLSPVDPKNPGEMAAKGVSEKDDKKDVSSDPLAHSDRLNEGSYGIKGAGDGSLAEENEKVKEKLEGGDEVGQVDNKPKNEEEAKKEKEEEKKKGAVGEPDKKSKKDNK